jgi:hypothetical protein
MRKDASSFVQELKQIIRDHGFVDEYDTLAGPELSVDFQIEDDALEAIKIRLLSLQELCGESLLRPKAHQDVQRMIDQHNSAWNLRPLTWNQLQDSSYSSESDDDVDEVYKDTDSDIELEKQMDAIRMKQLYYVTRNK